MSDEFAKLYGAGRDQVVAIRRDTDQDEPGEGVIQLFYDPQVEGLGVSTISLGFASTEARDQAWGEAEEGKVLSFIAGARKQLQEALANRVVGEKSNLVDAQGDPIYVPKEVPGAPAE